MPESCPDCGAPLKAGGMCSACGYGHRRKIKDAGAVPNYNRCSWQFASERCAYLARIFPHTPSRGDGLCWDHYGCQGDSKRGREIVSESLRKVPMDYDYSTRALCESTLEAYHKRTELKR